MKTIRELIRCSGGMKNVLLGFKEGAEYWGIAAFVVAFYVWLFVCITKI